MADQANAAGDDGWITPPEDHPVAAPPTQQQSAHQASQGDAGWVTPPKDHPTAPPIDWSDKLNEDDALKYINSLPEDQREHAKHSWADEFVHQVWAHNTPGSNAQEAALGRFLPNAAMGYMPRIEGARKWLTGRSYEMGKALEEAKERRIEAEPSTKLLETPFGDVYTSGLEKAAGVITGAAALPMARPFAGETFLPRVGNMAVNAGGYSALAGSAEGETPQERAGNALIAGGIGAVTGPAASEIIGGGARVLGAGRRLVGRSVEEAVDPQLGADRQLLEAMKASGATPEQLSQEVVPIISNVLTRRGMTQGQVADFVRRGLAGEAPADLAKDFPLTAPTIQRYLDLYQAQNPTKLNMMDLTDLLVGPGGALPMTRAGRSAFIISRHGESAENIINRQIEQPGRVADIVRQSGGGKPMDERLRDIATTLKAEEDKLYAGAKRSKTPVDLDPILSKWHADFPDTGEAHNTAMNNAVNLFYNSGYVATPKGGTRFTKLAGPIDDVDSFLSQRRKLDDMIDASYNPARTGPGRQASNLTRDLLDFRKEINGEFRAKNPLYAAADDKFSGNRTTERLLNQGADMALTMKANRYLERDFGKLTPSQQELIRVGFEQNLAERALSKQEGAAVANAFQTPAFKQVVETLYPQVGRNKTIYNRGQQLVQNLKREAVTTRTKSNIFANSNTAQTTYDLADAMRGAYTAAHAVTGDLPGMFHDVGKWLARQIGTRQSTRVIQTLSETDPAKMLEHLERLGQLSKNNDEAQIYRDLMRNTRRKILERAIIGGQVSYNNPGPVAP